MSGGIRAPTPTGASPGDSASGPLALAALAFLPLLLFAALADLWAPDEPRYAEIAREAWGRGGFLVMHLNGAVYPDKPPLLYWLAGATGTLGGFAELAIRVPSLLATFGTAWLVWRLARRWWGAREAALAPFFWLATVMVSYIGGRLQIARGNIDEGSGLYERAAKTSPRNAGKVYADLAAALAERKDEKLSGRIESALKSAASADPPHVDAMFDLGQSYVSAGKPEGKVYLKRYLDAEAKLPDDQRDKQKMQLARKMIRAVDILNQVR